MARNRELLEDLVVTLAALMPSAPAAAHASLEWRGARAKWLEAVEHIGFTEDRIRALSTQARLAARGLVAAPAEGNA